MNTPTKLAAYALVLLTAFGAAAGVGNAVGPIATETERTSPRAAERGSAPGGGGGHAGGHGARSSAPTAADTAAGGAGHGGSATAAADVPGGLMISQHGYTLRMAADTLPAGDATPVSFRITGPDGQPVTAYDETHDEDLHLIAVRRDMTGFQHVHPELAADGTWSVPLTLTAGHWRVFADFTPAGHGEAITLGADAAVAGEYDPQPLPAPATTSQAEDYTVTLDGRLVPGQDSELTLSVSRDGRPVTDLQPYLSAYGHLVALREGDLAYLHVHPAGRPGDGVTEPGPDVTFYATVPSVGDYRLFLDFKHQDAVRTAEFTARAAGGDAPAPAGEQGTSSPEPPGPAQGTSREHGADGDHH